MKSKFVRGLMLCGSLLLGALPGTSVALLAQSSDDSQSLGDAARAARQKKQQQEAKSSATAAKPVPSKKVITNEEIPSATDIPSSPNTDTAKDASSAGSSDKADKPSAESVKAGIARQKDVIASMQGQMDALQNSVHYVDGNRYRNGAQYNDAQRKKQAEVDRMQQRLNEEKQKLSDMQESARKAGFGSAVYD